MPGEAPPFDHNADIIVGMHTLTQDDMCRLRLLDMSLAAAGLVLVDGPMTPATISVRLREWGRAITMTQLFDREPHVINTWLQGDSEGVSDLVGPVAKWLQENPKDRPRHVETLRDIGLLMLINLSTGEIRHASDGELGNVFMDYIRFPREDEPALMKLKAYATFCHGFDFSDGAQQACTQYARNVIAEKLRTLGIEIGRTELTDHDIVVMIMYAYRHVLTTFPDSYEDMNYPAGLIATAKPIEQLLTFLKCEDPSVALLEMKDRGITPVVLHRQLLGVLRRTVATTREQISVQARTTSGLSD